MQVKSNFIMTIHINIISDPLDTLADIIIQGKERKLQCNNNSSRNIPRLQINFILNLNVTA